MPRVSVILPARNSAATILRALESVRSQCYPAIEIVVVDDASTDGTADMIAKWGNAGLVRLVSLKENVGAARARNICMELATGEYFAFLDADDEWLPGKLEAQVKALESNPAAALCTCNSERIGLSGNVSLRTFAHFAPHTGSNAWRTLIRYNFMPTPTILARAAAVRAVGGFRPDLVVGEDLDLWIRLATEHECVAIPSVLVRFYDSPKGLSLSYASTSSKVVLPMLRRHLDRLGNTIPPSEARDIWSERLYRTALELREFGEFAEAAGLFWRAGVIGPRRFRALYWTLRCLLWATPPQGRRRSDAQN